MKIRTLKLAIILSCVFMISLILFPSMILAEPTNETYDNDTWYDNHWGGDTGDNEYVELPPPDVIDDGPTGYKVCCLSSYFVISSVIGMATVQKFKHKRLDDE